MKKNFLLAFLLCLVLNGQAQPAFNYCQDYKKVLQTFRDYSFSQMNIQSLNNALFFENFLQALDPFQVILSGSEVQRLKSYVNLIKQDPDSAYCLSRQAIVDMYQTGIDSSLALLPVLKMEVPDFSRPDSLPSGQLYDTSYFRIPRINRWERLLKFRVLQELIAKTSTFDSLNQEQGWFKKIAAQDYLKIIDLETGRLKQLLSNKPDFESRVFFSYVNSLLVQFDPHAYYFSKEAFSDFREQLSTLSDSYGIQIEMNKDGHYYVSGIVPGSYSWRTGQINLGDEILEIATGNRDPIKLKYATNTELADYLSASAIDNLTLSIANKSGQFKTVVLHREKLQNTENELQAYMLKGVDKIGYIQLPAFYTSWESDKSAGCAQDMAKALYALKKDTAQAVIIDLRNNGGGSIKEALELAGIFVDFGILSMQQDRSGLLYPLRDMNRGTIYSGPLALLVNQGSASASEMVAAILQDYHRALIIGTPTFGKASGQIMIPVGQNSLSSKNPDLNEMNTLKITVNKFYRITGKSYQRTGIVPDVILPGLAAFHTESEARYPYALPNDSVEKKVYFNALPPLPYQKLNALSRQRIAQNNKFSLITRLDRDMVTAAQKYTYIPLNASQYFAYVQSKEQIDRGLNSVLDSVSAEFRVQDVSSGKNIYNFYNVYPILHKEMMKVAASDPFIEEAYNILHDYIHLPK